MASLKDVEQVADDLAGLVDNLRKEIRDSASFDKLVRIGKGAKVGHIEKSATDLGITTVGKNAQIRDKIVIARGAVVEADSVPEGLSS